MLRPILAMPCRIGGRTTVRYAFPVGRTTSRSNVRLTSHIARLNGSNGSGTDAGKTISFVAGGAAAVAPDPASPRAAKAQIIKTIQAPRRKNILPIAKVFDSSRPLSTGQTLACTSLNYPWGAQGTSAATSSMAPYGGQSADDLKLGALQRSLRTIEQRCYMKIRYAGALAVAAAAVLFQCVPVQAAPDDSRIEQSAKDSYAFKTYLSDDHIRVKARDGVVTLTGSVADQSQRDLAANTVANLPGVVSVNNELKIKGGPGEGEHSDKWLAMKVKSALLFHRNVSAKDTKVVAQNGVVTLTGTARSEAQKELTGEYAKDVDGVASVNNMITVNGGATVVESAGAQNNVANPIETS